MLAHSNRLPPTPHPPHPPPIPPCLAFQEQTPFPPCLCSNLTSAVVGAGAGAAPHSCRCPPPSQPLPLLSPGHQPHIIHTWQHVPLLPQPVSPTRAPNPLLLPVPGAAAFLCTTDTVAHTGSHLCGGGGVGGCCATLLPVPRPPRLPLTLPAANMRTGKNKAKLNELMSLKRRDAGMRHVCRCCCASATPLLAGMAGCRRVVVESSSKAHKTLHRDGCTELWSVTVSALLLCFLYKCNTFSLKPASYNPRPPAVPGRPALAALQQLGALLRRPVTPATGSALG